MRYTLSPVLCFCVLICSSVFGEVVDSSVSTSWTFSDSSLFEMTYSYRWLSHDPDIRVKIPIGLDDAIFGKTFSVDVHRIVRNTSCVLTPCRYCRQQGVITSKTKTHTVEKVLHSPCPVCKGTKMAPVHDCTPYMSEAEKISVTIPRGSRLGFEITAHQKGNQVRLPGPDEKVKIGDVVVAIAEISTGGFNVTWRGVELSVPMTPLEAMHGFKKDIPYINNTMVKIDRTNKTTLPMFEITLPGQGLPLFESTDGTINADSNAPFRRDNLILRFEFEREKEGDDKEFTLYSPDLGIDLQTWLQEREEKMAKRKKDKTLKAFLWKMKQVADLRKEESGEDNDHSDSYYT